MTSAIGIRLPEGFILEQLCVADFPCKGGQSVAIEVDDEPATYRYEIQLRSPAAGQLTIEGEAATEEFFVNGPNCEPRTANATFVVDEAGAVTVSHP